MIKKIFAIMILVMICLGGIQISKGSNIKTCKITNQTRFYSYPLKQIVLDRNVSGDFFLLSGTLNNVRTYLFYINDQGSSYKLMEVYYKNVGIYEVKGKPMAVLDTRDCVCRCDSYGGCDPDKLMYRDDKCVFWHIFLPPGSIRTNIDVSVRR